MRFRNRAILLTAILAVAIGPPAFGSGGAPAGQTPETEALPQGLPDGWYARVRTSLGEFVARLLPEQAPQSVAHFAAFADGRMTWNDPFTGEKKSGPYFDGVGVHKIARMERFEAGDWTGTGRGAPPVWVPPEITGAMAFSRPYRMGLTRAPAGRISATIFFVTATSQSFLNARHPCIGEIVLGREVVDRIVAITPRKDGKPIQTITIESVRIVKVGEPAPLQDPIPYTPPNPVLGPKEPGTP